MSCAGQYEALLLFPEGRFWSRPHCPLCPGISQGKPLTTDRIRRIVDWLAAEASIARRHNLHAFRHRDAKARLESGINAEIVSKALGRADDLETGDIGDALVTGLGQGEQLHMPQKIGGK